MLRWVFALWLGAVATAVSAAGEAAESLAAGVNPGYHPQPAWFKQSFLDLREDVAEAAAGERRVLLYFYQDGCPYCAKLLADNFGQQAIAEKTQRLYDVIAINMWGDREVTDLDGRSVSEKAFAADHRIMFTPTLVFLDEGGEQVLRLNGYYHPHKFTAALDYGTGKAGAGMAFPDYLDSLSPVEATGFLHPEPFFMPPPYNLDRTRVPGQRPLLVLFEQKECLACDEMHGDVMQREDTGALMRRFDVVQLDRLADTPVITPAGERTTAKEWASKLAVKYAPSMLFFDERGNEVFRAEAYLKTFHVQSALEYIARGAYREQPEFQRFVQARADRLHEEGEQVNIWD